LKEKTEKGGGREGLSPWGVTGKGTGRKSRMGRVLGGGEKSLGQLVRIGVNRGTIKETRRVERFGVQKNGLEKRQAGGREGRGKQITPKRTGSRGATEQMCYPWRNKKKKEKWEMEQYVHSTVGQPRKQKKGGKLHCGH